MACRLVITGAARKDLDQLPTTFSIAPTRRFLAENPRPFGSEKLQGFENLYQIRVGKYRVIYEIDKSALTVPVAKVEHRKSVYRKR